MIDFFNLLLCRPTLTLPGAVDAVVSMYQFTWICGKFTGISPV